MRSEAGLDAAIAACLALALAPCAAAVTPGVAQSWCGQPPRPGDRPEPGKGAAHACALRGGQDEDDDRDGANRR